MSTLVEKLETPIETSPADEAAFYDARWEKEFGQPLRHRKLTRIAAILSEIAELRLHEPALLEIGSGTGALAGILRNVGRVTGVELSPRAVELARQRYPDVCFISGSVFDVSLPAAAFDLVVAHEVIEHVDDQAGLLERIQCALRPGGHLVLTTPNATVAEHSEILQKASLNGGLQPRENLLTIRQLQRLLREARLDVRRLYTVVHAGRGGMFRVLNSPRLLRFRLWRRLLDESRLGLHTVVVARSRSSS